jgi:hypothetical protein
MDEERRAVEAFISRVEDFDQLGGRELVDYFVYYLTNERGRRGVSPGDVLAVFMAAGVPPYKRVRQYLHEETLRGRRNGPRYVRTGAGYSLARHVRAEIASRLRRQTPEGPVLRDLRDLARNLPESAERTFLEEAVRCFEVEAYRAAIVMAWIVTLDHLYGYILAHKLQSFNAALSQMKDRRVRTSNIASRDDFSDIPEGKFIEICRNARIISNDVRKILEQKLDTRNSAAHPSGVIITPVKASEFIHDLVHNVILKYQL